MTFRTEADLCSAFLSAIPKAWTPYPETCGFDIVLVHNKSGVQIAVEAKLILNVKVLCQIAQYRDRHWSRSGPDFRAVLVGRAVADTADLARMLGVTVIELRPGQTRNGKPSLWPTEMPDMKKYRADDYWWGGHGQWNDEAPEERLTLPEYVPHVAAGVPAPITLSSWTIASIKLCILAERVGYLTRRHFAELRLSPTRWLDGKWMVKAEAKGQWLPGPTFPADRFKAQHPITFAEIDADWPKWGEPILAKIGGAK